MLLKKALLVTTVAATVATAAVATAGSSVAEPTVAGTYNTITPTRVLDTINGIGAPKAAIGAGKTLTFSTAAALKTSVVSAESLTVTAVVPKARGYLLAYTGGAAMPATSTLNLQPARTSSNAAIVAYGAAGTVSIYNASTQPVQVLVDLSGYWTGGTVSADTSGAYHPVADTRIFSTRTANTPVAAGGVATVPVTGQAGIPTSGVTAVAVNLTVSQPSVSGFLTATASPTDQAGAASPTSDLNFVQGSDEGALTIVPVNSDGTISVTNAATQTNTLLVDAVGYFTGDDPYIDGSYFSSTPYRNSDTRTGAALASGGTLKVPVVPDGTPPLFKAVAISITETAATKAGYLTAWDGTGTRPKTQALFFSPRNETTLAIVPVNADGTISIYNGSMGSTGVIIDVHGFVLNDVSGSPAAARAQIHTALNRAHQAARARLAH